MFVADIVFSVFHSFKVFLCGCERPTNWKDQEKGWLKFASFS